MTKLELLVGPEVVGLMLCIKPFIPLAPELLDAGLLSLPTLPPFETFCLK